MLYIIFISVEKAIDLASKVEGKAIPLAELENFHPEDENPEDGMILANATPVGMKPNIDDTPLNKVSSFSLHTLIK